ncbi:hypothetical protein BDV11DRAFT_165806 [Aspergillus similis]
MDSLLRLWLSLALFHTVIVAWASSASTTSTSGVVEVDLIFPRNETFAPSDVTPIIFGIQTPNLLHNLDATLSWSIGQNDVDLNTTSSYAGVGLHHLSEIITNSTAPYILKTYNRHLNKSGSFSMTWQISYGNCSRDLKTDDVTRSVEGAQYWVRFTTAADAPEPNLVAATDEDTCNDSSAFAFNVTAMLDNPGRDQLGWQEGPSCAVLPRRTDLAEPRPTPCNVKIDEKTAENITETLYQRACDWPLDPPASCPAPTPMIGVGTRVRLPRGGLWGLGILGVLVYGVF